METIQTLASKCNDYLELIADGDTAAAEAHLQEWARECAEEADGGDCSDDDIEAHAELLIESIERHEKSLS